MASKKDLASVPPPGSFGRVKNSLKMGIVGLPNVGKSSLFNLLGENAAADAANYPFCTIDPNTTRCMVPDDRYKFLCDLWKPKSQYPAFLHLVDIAGLIKGASEGAGLGNAFLSHIQAVDGIFHVVRAFGGTKVVHVDDSVDPVRDLETITSELCKKDIQYVTRCRADREADVKKNPKMKLPPLFFTMMDKAMERLQANQPLGNAEWTAPEIEKINELIPECITTKPVVYLVNVSGKDMRSKSGNKHLASIRAWVDSRGGGTIIPFSVEIEARMKQIIKDGGTPKATSVLPQITTSGYKALNLMYYFTAGEKEVRCWTVKAGVTAPVAAGVIHSDFEKTFVKAEVTSFADFKAHCGGKKGMAGVKAAGKYRMEGKSYVVQDGDILHFKAGLAKKRK